MTVAEINREQVRLIDQELDRLKQMGNVVDLSVFVKHENDRRLAIAEAKRWSQWEADKRKLQPITKERSRRVNG